MNLPLNIARRYLFAKKSTNAINIITGISVLGMTIGTAALVIVLSVFNGFEDLLSGLFSQFNPDVKVTLIKGKFFDPKEDDLLKIKALDGVDFVSQSLEEVAFFEYNETQDFGIVKGVDEFYKDVSSVDSTIVEGEYVFEKGNLNYAVLGSGMAGKLGVNTGDPFQGLSIFMTKKKKARLPDQQFRRATCYPHGIFKIQQDFDSKYVLTSLEFAREILDMENAVSALEIKLNENADPNDTKKQISQILGNEYVVKDRYQQDEAFLKLMNMERWLYFALFTFMIIIIAFNMVGALWMIVMEKKNDIAILKSMGANNQTVRNIFLNEGLLLCGLGITIGFAVALLIYWLQKSFGIISIPEGFLIDSYPMSLRLGDLVQVGFTVLIIGLIASLPPAFKAMKIPAMIQEQ